MVDANQVWDVDQAIDWMRALAPARPRWIEEPTSPDDILGHARIARALEPLGIRVATGEHAHNRVMFKQFLQAEAIGFCQIDGCRLGGVNEVLAVLLLAAKFGVPGLPPRRRRRAVRVRPAPGDLRLHRGQRLARGAGGRVRRPPARAFRGSGDRPGRSLHRPDQHRATASRCGGNRWSDTHSPAVRPGAPRSARGPRDERSTRGQKEPESSRGNPSRFLARGCGERTQSWSRWRKSGPGPS